MQNSRTVEIWVGVFVALGFGALFVLAMKVSNIAALGSADGYPVTAHFQNIAGLREKAQVTMAGVQVGRVTRITLDPQSFEARVELTIRPEFDNIPTDSSASILTSGLLGEKYVGLEPGGSPDSLQPGDELMLTQSALVLEKIIGQFLFNQASGSEN